MLDNARYLHDGLAALGYEVMEPNRLPDGSELITPIVPVLVRDDWRAVLLWKALYDAGVYVNVAIYPAVQRGGALLRTSVMATHEREHLDRALVDLRASEGRGRAHGPADGLGRAPRRRSRKARAFARLPQVSILHQRPERFFEWSKKAHSQSLARDRP